MTIYTNVFGGGNIAPSDVSYRRVTLVPGNNVFVWPTETEADANYVTRVMDVSFMPPAVGITANFVLPNAQYVSVGETIFINNVGSSPFNVLDSTLTPIAIVQVTASMGNVVQLYLTDNTTQAGQWRIVVIGAGSNTNTASNLASTGLSVVGDSLIPAFPISPGMVSNIGVGDWGRVFIWTAGDGTVTIDPVLTLRNGWYVLIRNQGGGDLTIDPSGSSTINGVGDLILRNGDSVILNTDGSNFYTFGYGQAINYAFNSVNLTSADFKNDTNPFTLSTNSSYLNRISYVFSGRLDVSKPVVLPATSQQYWIVNNTTGSSAAGAGNLVFSTSSTQSTFTVPRNSRSILFVDSEGNVWQADTGGNTFPLSIVQGGTGATNVLTALTNLGATSIGRSVFSASGQAAAQTALGVPSADYVDDALANLFGIAVALG